MKPTPTLNVNLTPCACGKAARHSAHVSECPGIASILIPCPIPRSVTFEVRIGECAHPCTARISFGEHWAQCPARTVKVSCSISGETWAESEPTEIECREELPVGWHTISGQVVKTCLERWALVKALVLGKPVESIPYPLGAERWLAGALNQRDAVYAALTDMARAEQAAHAAEDRIPRDIRDTARGIHYWHATVPEHRPSAVLMARYVERLIETIGVLP